jgi:tRNA(Ile)-lysidine synthase
MGAGLDREQTSVIEEGVAGQERGSVTADGGQVVVEWSAENVGVRRLLPTLPFRYGLTVPGETSSDEFGWRFVAFEEPFDGMQPGRADLDVRIDPSKANGTLYFRTAKPGDMLQPLGFEGRRKLSDLLSEAGLTAAARARLPIVCDMIGPFWAPGVCLDERVRPAPSTRIALRIRFERLENEDT